MSALTRAAAGFVVDLLVPRRCGLCGAFGSFLCDGCAASLPGTTGPRCRACARRLVDVPDDPSHDGALCRRCQTLPGLPLDSLAAAFRFEGDARRLVHRLKYERLSALAEPMGAAMAGFLVRAGGEYDLLVPVPLHRHRERDRGFNQSALLARAIGRRQGIAVAPRALVRTRATAQQARIGGPEARAANVAEAFACRSAVAGLSVLLIDDVATTGATLRACAEPLRAAGARAVHALVFAHED